MQRGDEMGVRWAGTGGCGWVGISGGWGEGMGRVATARITATYLHRFPLLFLLFLSPLLSVSTLCNPSAPCSPPLTLPPFSPLAAAAGGAQRTSRCRGHATRGAHSRVGAAGKQLKRFNPMRMPHASRLYNRLMPIACLSSPLFALPNHPTPPFHTLLFTLDQ